MSKEVEKIDDTKCKVTTTYERILAKEKLLDEKRHYEKEVIKIQQEIARIDEILAVFN